MRHTVIAVFDQPEDARQAVDAVKARGFDASAVHRRQDDGPIDAGIPPAAEIESGPLSGLLDRLSSLFGVDAPHLTHYEEAVRRGGSVVQVDAADEAQAAVARDTLLAVGAVNIDDRVAEWERTGWRSPAVDAATIALAPGAEGAVGVVHRHEVSIGGVRVYGHAVVLGFDELADNFRADYEAQYAAPGTSYDDFDPAYRYGHALASDTLYDGRSWDEIEPQARAEWERRHQHSGWERFRRAVRHAWEHATRH